MSWVQVANSVVALFVAHLWGHNVLAAFRLGSRPMAALMCLASVTAFWYAVVYFVIGFDLIDMPTTSTVLLFRYVFIVAQLAPALAAERFFRFIREPAEAHRRDES